MGQGLFVMLVSTAMLCTGGAIASSTDTAPKAMSAAALLLAACYLFTLAAGHVP